MNLQNKFKKLEKLLLKKRETFYIQSGSPFVLFIYDPYQELECRRKIKETIEYLQHKKLKIDEIAFNTFVFELLEKYNVLEETSKKERRNFKEFTQEITKLYLKKIKTYVLNLINNDSQAVFLTRIGSISPFFRVSGIIEQLLNEVKKPTVIFYPGTYVKDEINNEEQVFFLGKYASNSMYRTYPIN